MLGFLRSGQRWESAQLAHVLRQVPLFRDIPARDLDALWRHLEDERVPAGTVICKQGDPGDRFYIIQTGTVEVRVGAAQLTIVSRLKAGDYFGEMALLTGASRSADVVAVEDTTLWSLDRATFDSILAESVPLLRALCATLAKRLASTLQLLRSQEGARSSSPSGIRFGPYRVVEQIGAGGMAVVYSAVEDGSENAVALKVLPASWGTATTFRERLQREAAVLQRLNHPGVIKVLGVGEASARLGGGFYIAMEWLPHALDRVLHAQYPEPLAPSTALRIVGGVADALAAVHANGLIHRDVKPSNILMRADGGPVLSDFGLATALADTMRAQKLTAPDSIVGTADYLSPEQIDGRSLDGRTDIYALGIVLYEMLVGLVPFAGRDPVDILNAQRSEPLPPLPNSVPPAVADIVIQATRKNPDQRFRSAEHMARTATKTLAALA
jgi:CRP-like cAMP-binding protein